MQGNREAAELGEQFWEGSGVDPCEGHRKQPGPIQKEVHSGDGDRVETAVQDPAQGACACSGACAHSSNLAISLAAVCGVARRRRRL